MIIVIECVVLCFLFTFMVYIISRNPIKTLYNYPPKIQNRVRSLDEYKNSIPTSSNKIIVKLLALIVFLMLLSFILRYINGYSSFIEGFGYSFLLWTIVNLWDVIVLDIIWFCHDKHFVFKGTEDMIDEYHNYSFHIKGFIIGECMGLMICFLVGIIIQFIL